MYFLSAQLHLIIHSFQSTSISLDTFNGFFKIIFEYPFGFGVALVALTLFDLVYVITCGIFLGAIRKAFGSLRPRVHLGGMWNINMSEPLCSTVFELATERCVSTKREQVSPSAVHINEQLIPNHQCCHRHFKALCTTP